MSAEYKIELSEAARAVVAELTGAPEWLPVAIAREMDNQNELTLQNIVENHLTGHGPFPVDEHRLGTRSSRLRGSARRNDAVIRGGVVDSSIGTNVVYAGPHEFGAVIKVGERKGTARLRTDYHGALMGQRTNAKLAVFAKRGHKRVREVEYTAKAHEIVIPARAPFGSGVEERIEEYGPAISEAILEGKPK